MGMFDSLFDADGREWQTKAFDCALDEYQIGDPIPADTAVSYQVEVISSDGSQFDGTFRLIEALATIRSGVLTSIGDRRDASLPLLEYGGRMAVAR